MDKRIVFLAARDITMAEGENDNAGALYQFEVDRKNPIYEEIVLDGVDTMIINGEPTDKEHFALNEAVADLVADFANDPDSYKYSVYYCTSPAEEKLVKSFTAGIDYDNIKTISDAEAAVDQIRDNAVIDNGPIN